MIDNGSIYLVVRDFEKSIDFYKKLLEKDVSAQNKTRFAIFNVGSLCLCMLNGFYDKENPDKVVFGGDRNPLYDNYVAVSADKDNSRKFVINLGTPDLRKEYERIKALDIGSDLTGIQYVNAGTPYWFFCLRDPDGNTIEITGIYTPQKGELL